MTSGHDSSSRSERASSHAKAGASQAVASLACASSLCRSACAERRGNAGPRPEAQYLYDCLPRNAAWLRVRHPSRGQRGSSRESRDHLPSPTPSVARPRMNLRALDFAQIQHVRQARSAASAGSALHARLGSIRHARVCSSCDFLLESYPDRIETRSELVTPFYNGRASPKSRSQYHQAFIHAYTAIN